MQTILLAPRRRTAEAAWPLWKPPLVFLLLSSIAFTITSGSPNFWGLLLDDEVYVCKLYNNHHTDIILDINCCTTLLTLAIQLVRVRLEVTLEPALEAYVTLRIESNVELS
jgi:hypothetical protein